MSFNKKMSPLETFSRFKVMEVNNVPELMVATEKK